MTEPSTEILADADIGDAAEQSAPGRGDAYLSVPDHVDTADALEQRIEVEDTPLDELPAALPDDADPADIAEQHRTVPIAEGDDWG